MTESMIKMTEVADRLGVTRNTVFKWSKDGRLPPPTKRPGKAAAWPLVEIEDWERKVKEVNEYAKKMTGITTDSTYNYGFQHYAETAERFLTDTRVNINARHKGMKIVQSIKWTTRKLKPHEITELIIAAEKLLLMHDTIRY